MTIRVITGKQTRFHGVDWLQKERREGRHRELNRSGNRQSLEDRSGHRRPMDFFPIVGDSRRRDRMHHARLPKPLPSPRERYQVGKRIRARLPREAQAEWASSIDPPPHRLAVLAQVNTGRIAALLPVKQTRMRASPFAFWHVKEWPSSRGTAARSLLPGSMRL